MITFFSVPKPFKWEYELIQRNAVLSWKNILSDSEVILFGNEEGVKKFAEEYNVKHIPEIFTNEYGTPLLNDVFEKAQKIGKYDILCYINCDIILTSDFKKAVEMVKNEEKFLLVGKRWNIEINEEIDFKNDNWENNLKKMVKEKGELYSPMAIDYFVFKKGIFKEIPPFAVGRTVFDEWLLWDVWRRRGKIIDATPLVVAIHQNHEYRKKTGEKFNAWKSKEGKINLKLAGGYKHCLTVDDATHILTEKGIKEAPKMGLIRRIDLLPFFGIFTRQRFKLKKFLRGKL